MKVCASCSGTLTRKDISENSCFTDHKLIIENYQVCESCSRIEHGIDKDIWDKTYKALEEREENFIKDLNDNDYEKRSDARHEMSKYVYFSSILLKVENEKTCKILEEFYKKAPIIFQEDIEELKKQILTQKS